MGFFPPPLTLPPSCPALPYPSPTPKGRGRGGVRDGNFPLTPPSCFGQATWRGEGGKGNLDGDREEEGKG